jgi:starch synthase
VGIVSRLTVQKGLDLIECEIHEIMELGVQLAVLGSGDPKYENLFSSIQDRYPGRARIHTGYDMGLAQKIYAGSDMFLMPSLFEPCGLGQLISMRYGSVPVVRETGGLKDTVKAYSEFTGEGNGFSFTNYNAHDMLHTIERAVEFYSNKDVWKTIVKQAMECDYSWDSSAVKYIEIYEEMQKGRL